MRVRTDFVALLFLAVLLVQTGSAQGFKGAVEKVLIEQEGKGYGRRKQSETTYAPDGRTVAAVFLAYSYTDGSLRYKGATRYDDAGRPTVQAQVAADGSEVGRIVFRHDAGGRLVEKTTLDAAGAETAKEENRYEGDRLVERKLFRRGKLWRRIETEYRPDGTRKAKRRYGKTGQLEEVSTYGAKGELEKAVHYKKDGTVRRSGTAEYDAEGRVIKTINLDGAGKVTSTTTRSYNERGDLARTADVTLGRKSETARLYEYDAQGNWTKQVVRIDGRTTTTIYRTFTYHR